MRHTDRYIAYLDIGLSVLLAFELTLGVMMQEGYSRQVCARFLADMLTEDDRRENRIN